MVAGELGAVFRLGGWFGVPLIRLRWALVLELRALGSTDLLVHARCFGSDGRGQIEG